MGWGYTICSSNAMLMNMVLVARVFDQVILKPDCPATNTGKNSNFCVQQAGLTFVVRMQQIVTVLRWGQSIIKTSMHSDKCGTSRYPSGKSKKIILNPMLFEQTWDHKLGLYRIVQPLDWAHAAWNHFHGVEIQFPLMSNKNDQYYMEWSTYQSRLFCRSSYVFQILKIKRMCFVSK